MSAKGRAWLPQCGGVIALYLFFAAPSTSQASCGDYLPPRGQNSDSMRSMVHEDSSTNLSSHTPMPGKKRCSGLFCDSVPTIPPLIPIKIILERPNDSAIPLESDFVARSSRQFTWPVDSILLSAPDSLSIFHPPRTF